MRGTARHCHLPPEEIDDDESGHSGYRRAQRLNSFLSGLYNQHFYIYATKYIDLKVYKISTQIYNSCREESAVMLRMNSIPAC